MSVLFILSIVIRITALGLCVSLLLRTRDWRVGLVTSAIVPMAVHQLVDLRKMDMSSIVFFNSASDFLWFAEDLLTLLAIVAIVQFVRERRRAEQRLAEKEQQYKSLYELNPDAVYTVDLYGNFLSSNPACEKVTGYQVEDLLTTPLVNLVASEDYERAMYNFRRSARGEPRNFEMTIIHRRGHRVTLNVTNVPIVINDQIVGIYGIAKDITEQLLAEAEKAEASQRYQTLVESIDAIVWEIDLRTRNYTFVSPQAENVLGYQIEQWMEGQFWEATVHPEDLDNARTMIATAVQERQHSLEIEYRMIAKDGSTVWLKDNISIFMQDDQPLTLRGIMFDITERKKTEEKVRRLAYYDGLTGLPNRMLFEDRLQVEIARARRNHRKVAVMVLDLDRFKVINDTLGHMKGNELLKSVADRLSGCLYEDDTISRIGGDEFTFIIPDIVEVQDAVKVAQRLYESMARPFDLEDQEMFITGSIGISLYPDDGMDISELIKNAETAMYRAKEQGRNNYQLYTTAMNAHASERLALENDLRKALDRQEFVVFYQPQINASTGKIIGLEALIRWQHAALGMVSPAQFIPLAEETGLIVPIGEWVLRTACEQMKGWHDAGFPKIRVAVNLSARQFMRDDLVDMVRRILKETGLEAEYLDLEITESVTMQNVDRAVQTLNELRDLGIQISLDDFGTGYSSLSYLKNFPIYTLKIDRSFVRDITTDPDDAAIATSIIAMAHSLKLHVVAEGVELEEQLKYLIERGCHEMQGYFFSPPLPAAGIEELFESIDRTGTIMGLKP